MEIRLDRGQGNVDEAPIIIVKESDAEEKHQYIGRRGGERPMHDLCGLCGPRNAILRHRHSSYPYSAGEKLPDFLDHTLLRGEYKVVMGTRDIHNTHVAQLAADTCLGFLAKRDHIFPFPIDGLASTLGIGC